MHYTITRDPVLSDSREQWLEEDLHAGVGKGVGESSPPERVGPVGPARISRPIRNSVFSCHALCWVGCLGLG